MLSKRKRQIMFYQLGYYQKNFDGIWGSGSKAATKNFQKEYGLSVDGIYGSKTEAKLKEVHKSFMTGVMTKEDWKNIKYFKESEFKCKDSCGYKSVYKEQAYNLDALRYYLQTPIYITSGCRCSKHNKKVGGATSSRHYNKENGAKATDFYTNKTKNLNERIKIINFWIKYMPYTRYSYCNGYYNNLGKTGTKKVSSMGNAIHVDIK